MKKPEDSEIRLMRNMLKKKRRAQIRKFEQEVILKQFGEMHITGVMEDKSEQEWRVIILAMHYADKSKIEARAAQYFGEHSYKIIYMDEAPEATSTMDIGAGIHRKGSGNIGTMGQVFQLPNQNAFFGLSNNHVIGNCAAQADGTEILMAPQGNVLGNLYKTIPILPMPALNTIDAALFKLNGDVEGNWKTIRPKGVVGAQPGYAVYKSGHLSKRTEGVVTGTGTIVVSLCEQSFYFTDVIAIQSLNNEDFSQKGDSGSLVLTVNEYMVGLLFAKAGKYAYACAIKHLAPFDLKF